MSETDINRLVNDIESLDDEFEIDDDLDVLTTDEEIPSKQKKRNYAKTSDRKLSEEDQKLIEEFIKTKGIKKIEESPKYVEGALKNEQWSVDHIKEKG
jgi:hypothetical protein